MSSPSPRLFRFLSVLFLAVAFRAAADVTFYALSDLHYGQHSAAKDTARAHLPDLLNSLPGTAWPAAAGGGSVATPRAVLVTGDLIDRIDTGLWNAYAADYGVNGEKRVAFPVFDGLGNHDFRLPPAPADSLRLVAELIARNARRRSALTALDPAGYHYSWDWDGVHFVHLNLYGGGSEAGHNGYPPLRSLDFLRDDLAARVGTSGRPVIVLEHYPLDDDEYFPSPLRSALYDALRNYNVALILHGHSHDKRLYAWNGLDVIDLGTAMSGDLFVLRIAGGRLTAANRVNSRWGTLLLDKPVDMGTPAAIRNTRETVSGERMDLFDLQGRPVMGGRVPHGIYLARERGGKRWIGKVVR